jgi:hypothetical protein
MFAVDVIGFVRSIPRDPINGDIAAQLTDAATSVAAAHYRAVCRAKSRADFVNSWLGRSKKSMNRRSGSRS